MKPETNLNIASIVLGIIGLFIIVYFYEWKLALGIFIIIFGNNLMLHAIIIEKLR